MSCKLIIACGSIPCSILILSREARTRREPWLGTTAGTSPAGTLAHLPIVIQIRRPSALAPRTRGKGEPAAIEGVRNPLLLASHLTVHLPPRIGAYVLANHKTNASLITDPEVAGQNSRSNYVVKQRSQFRSPILGSNMALTAARTSAMAGHVPPGLIPFLASPNADIIQHRPNWTGPAPDDPHAHRFANLALHASGHNSNESLRNAIQLHNTFSQTNAMVTNPTFLRVPDPYNGTGQLTHSPVSLDHTVARWLREGAPRVTSRTHPNPSTRPFIPWPSFHFSMGSSASPTVVNLLPSTSLTLAHTFEPHLKNLHVMQVI